MWTMRALDGLQKHGDIVVVPIVTKPTGEGHP